MREGVGESTPHPPLPHGGLPSLNSFKGSGKLFYKGSGLGFTFIHFDKVKQIYRKSKKISSFDELQYRKK